jgi:hypothetical protein
MDGALNGDALVDAECQSLKKNIGDVMHDEQCHAYAVVAYKDAQRSRKYIFLSKSKRGNKPHGGTKLTKQEQRKKSFYFILFWDIGFPL